MNEDFKKLIKKASDARLSGGFIAIFLTGAISIGFIVLLISLVQGGTKLGELAVLPLLPVFLLAYGGYHYWISRKNVKNSDYWANMIEVNPEKVVWIKPIQVNHTAAYVITLYKTQKHFSLLSDDGLELTIECTSDEERKVFFEGLKHHLAHAHIGFSKAIEQIYYEDRANFIQHLKSANVYVPVERIDFEI